MKKLLAIIAAAIVAVMLPAAVAGATDYSGGFCTQPKPKNVSQRYYDHYCGVYGANGTYAQHYQSVYCYPNGSYWQRQIAAFPKYYAAHNAQYTAEYGC